jgi:hypothetical protein
MHTRRFAIPLLMGVLLEVWLIRASPVAAQAIADPFLTLGRASGFGTVAVSPGRLASFSFDFDPLSFDPDVDPVPGQLRFVNRVTGETVVSRRILSAFIGQGLVVVEGTCFINGRPGIFQMEAFDAERLEVFPSEGFDGFRPVERDNFFICYEDAFTGACVGGFVLSGLVNVDDDVLIAFP